MMGGLHLANDPCKVSQSSRFILALGEIFLPRSTVIEPAP